MKDFVKMTLAVICGFLIMGILLAVISFSFIGAVVAIGSTTPALPSSGALVIDLSQVNIGEQSSESNPLASFTGKDDGTISIYDAVEAVKTAAFDPTVKFIYLKTDNAATGVSYMEELRSALADFRTDSGKPIVAYTEAPSTGSYYMASVADKVYMTPFLGATIPFNGIATQSVFLGDLLKKFGVNVQLIRHGKYKSAGEMYTRSSSSPENREQYQRLVDSMWETLGPQIAESRGLEQKDLDAYIDNLELSTPQDFVRCGLVDELLDRNALEEKLAVLGMADDFKSLSMIPFADYVANQTAAAAKKQNIAIIYADGNIIDGSVKEQVAGDRFAALIGKVCDDSSIDAVVLRVNSPGGSVLASEKIKNELDRLKSTKPLVASYGSYAASGGYWISNNCEYIFSDATTLTGSIGVFGIVPDFSKTAKDVLHVGVESISSHKHGDMYGVMRPFDQSEYAYMTASIEGIYDKFVSIVSEGRSLDKERVDALGQGRVWTGADALTNGLVDEIGGLTDAVNFVAGLIDDPDFETHGIVTYPKPAGQLEKILSMFGVSGDDEDWSGRIAKVLGIEDGPKILARMDTQIEVR